MTAIRLTGGCQCGAVRYALTKMPERPAICHCRMCQKAMGNVFGTFGGVEMAFFELTRGEMAAFKSSDEAERLFCRDCGTPLAWRPFGRDWISVTLGSLDEPGRVRPVRFYGEEGRVPWVDEVVATHGTVTGVGARPDYAEGIHRSNRQHPDHDTHVWPPVSSSSP